MKPLNQDIGTDAQQDEQVTSPEIQKHVLIDELQSDMQQKTSAILPEQVPAKTGRNVGGGWRKIY